MPGPQLTGKHLLSGLCCGPDMSGPQHKPESRCLPVSCGPGMPGPYASTMFYHAITAHVPGTVKTVPYKAPVDPDL